MRLFCLNAVMVALLALLFSTIAAAAVAFVLATVAAVVAELPALLLAGVAFLLFVLAGVLSGRINRERSRKEEITDEGSIPPLAGPPAPGPILVR